MRRVLTAAVVLLAASTGFGQQKPVAPESSRDPMQLLQAVAKNYAGAADEFRLESITDTTSSSELRHDWNRVYRTAIKGPGSLYRIEIRTGFGSYVQLSDGVNEWVYQVDSNAYVKRPLPPDWPRFPKVMDMGFHELKQTWDQRLWLEEAALAYKRATLLPEETVVIDAQRYPCFVVRASSDDSIQTHDKDFHEEVTFWIDKQSLVFRKIRRSSDTYMILPSKLHVPERMETTEVFPVVEFDPHIAPETFRFTPPVDAKEVATLEPDFGPSHIPEHPKAQMVGQMAPDITLNGADGKKVALSSYRGKPLLIDFWATWCGPCLLAMPSISRIYADAKDRGLTVIGVDENNQADDGPVYLGRHHYAWTNFHDEAKAAQKAFQGEGIPLAVLVDATGKIVYFDFGGDEMALRKAVAALGPEFASVAQPAPNASGAEGRKN